MSAFDVSIILSNVINNAIEAASECEKPLIEQRRERMQEKKSSMDEMTGRNKNAHAKGGQQNTGLSKASMQAMKKINRKNMFRWWISDCKAFAINAR